MKITKEMVLQALESIGFTLVAGITINEDNKQCCPIGAIAYAAGHRLPESLLDVGDNLFGVEYTNGFVMGFDNPSNKPNSPHFKEEYLDGYNNGVAIRKELLGYQENV